MARRPEFITMPSFQNGTFTPPFVGTPQSGLPSPRMQPVAGDVAPVMSPLDMFAAQSRALAKQLEEESRRNGRRVSRLPPIAPGSLGSSPGGYFRSTSVEGRNKSVERETINHSSDDLTGNLVEIESSPFRPVSHYPRFSGIQNGQDPLQYSHEQVSTRFGESRPRAKRQDPSYSAPMESRPFAPPADYFGEARARSPESLRKSLESTQSGFSKPKSSFDSLSRSRELERGMSTESASSRVSQYSKSLLPPRPPYARNPPSIRSVSSDDDNPGFTPSSSLSQQRTLSSSSGLSAPQSPQVSVNRVHNRSPSQNSEYSINSNRLSRPAFNFSRPLSRSSQPSMDFTRPSMESQLRMYGDEEVTTPMSMDNERLSESKDEGEQVGSSYIYTKFSLPRGRNVQRESMHLDNMVPLFEWEKPKARGLEPITPSSNLQDSVSSLPTPPHSIESDEQSRTSSDSVPIRPPPIPTSADKKRHSLTSMNTMNSGSTIKGSQHTIVPSADLTAEDHLAKGIECHENGSLNESTYHLRLAARQNNPTGMLLYALACRHGWGMRPNQKEGVMWLRKAMDCASIELSNNDESPRGPEATEALKARRAQFALSVYELGVSHMNGWGIEQDKALALRCFEIASSWGDADAMAEAGFCYAQGVGCKKDLKKAAKYYRDAEAKGMSMVGNSW